jgi:AAA domain
MTDYYVMPKFAIGCPDVTGTGVGMKSGPYNTMTQALAEIGDDGDYIYRLTGTSSDRHYVWAGEHWRLFTEPHTDRLPLQKTISLERQAQDLLAEFRRIGLLNESTEKSELSDLVNFYGVNYLQYGPLVTIASLFPDYNLPKKTTPAVPTESKLSDDQEIAWTKLQAWLKTDASCFVLKGFAGTGKTWLLRLLKTVCRDIVYTAPTNKAAKVLGSSVGTLAKTTYSALGLRMEQQEDAMVLTESSRAPYYAPGTILVVDETSMVGQLLTAAILRTITDMGIRVIFVGDPAQLPPVGETRSPAWSVNRAPECNAMLRKVMRNDSQLLTLATNIRACIKTRDWTSPLRSDHDDVQGVWKWKTRTKFIDKVLERITCPQDAVQTKIIAWRNKTVDEYNGIVRKHLGFNERYCIGDQMLLVQPLKDGDTIIAHTDDDFSITDVAELTVSLHDVEIPVYEIAARQTDGDWSKNLYVPRRRAVLDDLLNRLARRARASKGAGRKLAWQEFWSVHEQFHDVRYGYAFTSHRAQGSTVTNVWVDQQDTLSNRNSREAFQCFYVQSTRPTTQLHSF